MSNRFAIMRPEIDGPDVLHVGCTGGLSGLMPNIESQDWIHGQILRLFPDAWGLDISADKITELRDRGTENLVVGDAEEFDLGKRFDTIVAGELIEHVERPGHMLRTFGLHLKPGGKIVLTTPYPFGLPTIMYAWLKFPKTCSNQEHTMWFCPSTLSRLAWLAGLYVEKWALLGDFPEGTGVYRIYTTVYQTLRPLIPRRAAANDMIFVLRARAAQL